MRKLLVSLLVLGAVSCSPAPIQRVVHVTTYRNGESDIVRRDLLFRGKLKPGTVKEVLATHGMAEDVTVVNGSKP